MSEPITSTIDPTAALKAQIALMQQAVDGTFNLEAKGRTMKQQEEAAKEAASLLLGTKANLFAFYNATNGVIPMPDFTREAADEEVLAKVKLALQVFTKGASATKLADFIGDYWIPKERISKFARETYLLKRTGTAQDTVYRLATPEETKAMQEEAAKEVEAAAAAEVAVKLAEKQAKAKVSAKKTKK